jgi:hypothetical protein
MKIPGLRSASDFSSDLPDGCYLVEIRKAAYRRKLPKPYFAIDFTVVEPKIHAGTHVPARVYSTPKALWKLHWFLCDFGYDRSLIEKDEVDERALAGLTGVVRLSHAVVNGTRYLNLDGFMSANNWSEIDMAEAA